MKIKKIIDQDVKILSDAKRLRPEKSEVDRLVCNNSKLIDNSEWKPKYDLDKGLKETIEWFKDNKQLYKSDQYNV